MSLFDADALAKAPVRRVLNPAKYHVRITKASAVISREKQTPGIELGFEVVRGPIQENQSDPMGHKFTNTIWSSRDEANRGPFYGRMHALADAIHFDLSVYSGMSAEEFEQIFLTNLVQKELVVTVDNEAYNGNLRETVKGFSALD